MNARVAIIGAGIAGCAAALRAAELGAKVTLLERTQPAAASSGLSAGVISAQTTNPIDIELRLLSRGLLDTMQQRRGLPFARIGGLRFASDDAGVARLQASVDFQRTLGRSDARILTRAQVKELVPNLQCDDVEAALFGPNEGHVDGHMYCSALLQEARALGVAVRNNTEIIGYRKTPGGHLLSSAAGDHECDVVINAAGAWAGRLGKLLGHAAPVRPEVHEVIIAKFAQPLPYVMPYCQFYFPGQQGEGVYFRQESHDTIICGLHTYESVDGLAVDDFDHYQPQHGEDHLINVAEKVHERLPIDDMGFKSGWFGLYPLSADGKFIVGPYKSDPTVIAAAGLGGVGLAGGPGAGICAAEWAVKGMLLSMPKAEEFLPDRESLRDLW